MEERYLRDKYLIEMTPEEEKKDILRNIFHTKAELTNANKNFTKRTVPIVKYLENLCIIVI